MAETVYILCGLTSLACAILLLRAYARTKTTILFWTSLCFVGLVANNVLLFVDLGVLPEIDLSLARSVTAFVSMLVLVWGLVGVDRRRAP